MAQTNKHTSLMITILGPTATGKTRLAAFVANEFNGEIISADSRQVYRGMDVGTGKDYQDYVVDGRKIKYHLVDIVEPGYEYSVFEFQHDFLKIFRDIELLGKMPVLCGGTGMYIEALLSGYCLTKVPENITLRLRLEQKNMTELKKILQHYHPLHNITDTADRQRAIRAIEIADFQQQHPDSVKPFPAIEHKIFGIHFERSVIKERITLRLKQRLNSGMTEEVRHLLNTGLKPEQLTFYGLEYRYLTAYVTGKIDYDEMFGLLNTAIHQFAKRQMTWFRRMQKKGHKIIWIDGNLSMSDKLNVIRKNLCTPQIFP